MLTAIAVSRNRNGVQKLLDLSHILIGERRRLAILHDARLLGRARDGNGTLATNPNDGHLRRRYSHTLRDLPYPLHELQILIEVFGLEARKRAPEVVLGQVVELA